MVPMPSVIPLMKARTATRILLVMIAVEISGECRSPRGSAVLDGSMFSAMPPGIIKARLSGSCQTDRKPSKPPSTKNKCKADEKASCLDE